MPRARCEVVVCCGIAWEWHCRVSKTTTSNPFRTPQNQNSQLGREQVSCQLPQEGHQCRSTSLFQMTEIENTKNYFENCSACITDTELLFLALMSKHFRFDQLRHEQVCEQGSGRRCYSTDIVFATSYNRPICKTTV